MDRNTATYFPLEIIENILFRLPVKSLLRFKSVCKQWNSTISDPKFPQNHLHISKNSSSSSFIVREQIAPGARLVSLENDKFRRLPAADLPPLSTPFCRLLCHCDGLYVIRYSVLADDYKYALWNPSRRSYKTLNQYTFNSSKLIHGICYDPLLDDYKVVMGDFKRYAVFYCRKNHWSDLRKMNHNFKTGGSGASLKGSIYWVRFCFSREVYEIVYFDGRDEKWKKLGKLVGINASAHLKLISSGEGLYLFQCYWSSTVSLFMKKVGDGDEWMELPAPESGGQRYPMLCGHENKLLLRHSYGDDVAIYDVSKRSLARVECSWNLIFGNGDVFPYQENMLCFGIN